MLHKLGQFWSNLRASLWFIPGVMIVASISAALLLIEIDTRIKFEWLASFPRLFGLGADGSRGMLTAIASSMLTVATLAFTLTLNAMTQASGQFTPRIFRNFMRDRANQFVLGYFVGVFVFCLIVLRTIRGGDEIRFIPSLAVMMGLMLAIGGVVVLVFFIHHIADSLQITTIIGNIVDETRDAVNRMFPSEMGRAANADEKAEFWKAEENQKWQEIPALYGGYIQSVDTDGALKFAEDNGLVLQMERGIGQFAGRGETLVSITYENENSVGGLNPDETRIDALNSLFIIDNSRTIEQDVGFGIRQIVDIALKALSPGVNDTTTAITCIDFLGEIVGEIARRQFPPKVRTGANGGRVVAIRPDFGEYVATAFDQIRISGRANFAIFERLLQSVAFAAKCTSDEERRTVLLRQIELIEDFASKTLETDYEKEKVRSTAAEKRREFGR